MFRSFIYLDEDKLYSYKKLIDGGRVPPKSISKKRTKAASAGLKGTNISFSDEENITTDIEKDPFWDYDRFELSLSELEGDDYFDFISNEGSYDICSVPAMKIFRMSGNISVPEEFDVFNLVESFKPLLLGSIPTKNENEQEMVNTFLGNAKADIPIVLEADDVAIVGKLNTKCLLEEYTALEEYEEQEITALCKVVGISRQDRVTVFNPLKDFIKLNRAMRRAGNFESGSGLDPIIIDGPVVKVEFIAIYK